MKEKKKEWLTKKERIIKKREPRRCRSEIRRRQRKKKIPPNSVSESPPPGRHSLWRAGSPSYTLTLFYIYRGRRRLTRRYNIDWSRLCCQGLVGGAFGRGETPTPDDSSMRTRVQVYRPTCVLLPSSIIAGRAPGRGGSRSFHSSSQFLIHHSSAAHPQ